MGYEFGFARMDYKDNDDVSADEYFDSIYWFICGWNHTEMHQAFAELAGTPYMRDGKPMEHYEIGSECVFEVSKLAFVKRLHEQLVGQKLIKIIYALLEIGEDYAYEFIESLPDGVMAAIRLSYVLEDATPQEQAICNMFLEDFDYGYYYTVEGLAEAYDKMVADGVEKVILFDS